MKKKGGCGSLVFVFIVFFATLGVLGGDGGSSTPKATATKAAIVTKIPSVTISEKPTSKPTTKQTVEPTEKPLVIYLRYPELGEYGRYYVWNLFAERATKDDMYTVIQCFVPPGTYTVTNVGRYPTCVFVYSKETIITDMGWEEAADGWASGILQVGDSCEVTVEEGYYIKLLQNDNFKLVQKSAK